MVPASFKDTIGPPPLNSPLSWEPPPSSSYKTSWSALSPGHSCVKGSFPGPWAHPNPNWQDVCISGEQILPLAWEFNDQPFQGVGWGLRIACLPCYRGTWGLTQQPIHRMGQGNSPGTAGVSKSNIPMQLICIFPDRDTVSSFNFLPNKRVSWCPWKPPHTQLWPLFHSPKLWLLINIFLQMES